MHGPAGLASVVVFQTAPSTYVKRGNSPAARPEAKPSARGSVGSVCGMRHPEYVH